MQRIEWKTGRHLVMMAACDEQNGIARNSQIPWDCPEDRAFFKHQTMGHPLIMGRKTRDTLPTFPLPGRFCAVLTHHPHPSPTDGVLESDAPDVLLDQCFKRSQTVYIIGGSSVYVHFLPLATDILISRIKGDWGCDAKFPQIDTQLFDFKQQILFSNFNLERYEALI